jgi:hypothetical protein
MRTSLQSFLLSSWSRRTPTLSRRRHPSPEEPPHRREMQPPPAELFVALGEHPRDPLSVLPFSLLCLVHRSTLAAVGCVLADLHRPSMDQRLRLEPEDIPSRFKSWSKI